MALFQSASPARETSSVLPLSDSDRRYRGRKRMVARGFGARDNDPGSRPKTGNLRTCRVLVSQDQRNRQAGIDDSLAPSQKKSACARN